MTRRFFWQMVVSLVIVALLLFSLLHQLAQDVTIQMTRLQQNDQDTLLAYAAQANDAQKSADPLEIILLTQRVADDLSVWSAIQTADGQLISATPIPVSLANNLGFQRHVYWPVHDFMTEVLIGMPLDQEGYSFVIELPANMHPRPNTSIIHTFLTLIVPSLVLLVFCWLFYRYLMKPLEALNRSTVKFAAGDLSVRVQPELSVRRRDEITQLASSFDSMADRIQRLVTSQRQLLGDLSHELRTPLTRLELALDLHRQGGQQAEQLMPRLSREIALMNNLVNDALTLAWLDGETEIHCGDQFNLATLLDLLCEDAAFEYPNHRINRRYSTECLLTNSNNRALAQSIENILRNALKYSPAGSVVTVRCETQAKGGYLLEVLDQGQGVEPDQLERIFEPFYRTDKARSREEGGFGLGLALVRRQIDAIGGAVHARLNHPQGLCIVLTIPNQGKQHPRHVKNVNSLSRPNNAK